jgi:hypothetical protein
MKTQIMSLSKFALLVMALSFFAVSCQKDDMNMGKNDMGKGIEAPDMGGNLECVGHDWSTGRNDYDPETDTFSDEWPEGLNVTVTDGKYVSFSLDEPFMIDGKCYLVGSVIMKGGPAAERYTYPDGSAGASGLTSPVNRGGNIPEISNLTFCFIEVDCPSDCVWKGQTAYGGDYEGLGAAWWYYFDTKGPATQKIFAGQKLVEGASVTYSDNKITIVLGPNMKLEPGKGESVKILGYDEIPDSRPASGGGPSSPRIYAGTDLIVTVDPFKFYVIHLDVEVLVCDDDE